MTERLLHSGLNCRSRTRLIAWKDARCPESSDSISGEAVIADAAGKNEQTAGAILSLIYAEGQRPGLEALAGLAGRSLKSVPFVLSHIPDAGEDWVELLAAGLTFDCHGLAPGDPAQHPGTGALLGLHDVPGGEAISLRPAPHLVEGSGLLPVVRILAGLGAELGHLPGLIAAHWQPAQCWMAPKYFRGEVEEWIGGGAFPALGLTSLQRNDDGSMISAGLGFLIGQELRFEPDRRLAPAAIARIAVRLIHSLIETGPLTSAMSYLGPEGEPLRVEPINHGRQLRVSFPR